MKGLPVILMLLLAVLGCKEKSKKDANQAEEVATNLTTEETPVKFPVYDYDGLEPILNYDDDKTYIVNFWATWCKPCIEELPDFERTFAEYEDKNVRLILVSLDMPSMWKSKLEPYVEEHGLKGEVIILDDPKMNDWIPKIDAEWDGGIPASLIYNNEKRQFYAQGFTYEELKSELDKFL
ncbi:TlpA family protein disulfide reductase [Croceivirga thetidis]|uniref:Redoxin domain-containing protein n=1 Tax=Croceivirga thetidis TaxID=2721623 RepID=A0ABX1GU10_9FLAO|nr:TlpA family protein disulfide reductase [Croceivirga thetidis]NKI33406.1 redoxin domain-containing protein [Croceivirga thetidis]